jgi:hypothetical protein
VNGGPTAPLVITLAGALTASQGDVYRTPLIRTLTGVFGG